MSNSIITGVEKFRVPDDVLEMIRNATTKEEAEAIELKWISENIETGKVKPYSRRVI